MRYSAAIFLSALACACATAGEYANRQAARMTIGQATFTDQMPGACESDGSTTTCKPSDRVLGAVGGVAYANDMLIVADATYIAGAGPSNRRVLIYRNISSKFPSATASIPVDTSRCPICTGRSDFPSGADVVLGQPNFTTNDPGRSQSRMAQPVAVATDGKVIAVADTDNNRVLIWNSIPTANAAPADVVLGQKDFDSIEQPIPTTASSLRAPRGVWIQDGRLYVADTLHNRVLIWNSIPTQNNQPADVVLGQPNFTTAPELDLTKFNESAHANTMLSPVSVTSDGKHLFVTDLGYHRILIWNSIPTQNQQPADVVIGEPDMDSTLEGGNDAKKVCESNGTDSSGNPTYPARCGATLSYPRMALADDQGRLYVADGGNDRVLIFNQIPVANGASADVVLGQPDMTSNIVTDASDLFNPNLQRSSSDTLRTPSALAWDGANLYVADPFDRRVVVFTPAQPDVPVDGIRNAASLAVYAVGAIRFTAAPKEGDKVTIKIADKEYSYTAAKDNGIPEVIDGLIAQINAGDGDPNFLAMADKPANAITLTARQPGKAANDVAVTFTLSDGAQLALTIDDPGGGADAARVAPGSLVSILGTNLSESAEAAPADADPLPTRLAGTEVYFDGIQAPLLYVSPTQINAQIPWEVLDSTSISAWVRTQRSDGSVTVSNAVGVPITIEGNPGIFVEAGVDPRPAIAYHFSSNATASVQIDGTPKSGETGTITIEDRSYTYTVQDGDSLATIRDALIQKINDNPDEKVVASAAATTFTRILLTAKQPGQAGEGIKISASTSSSDSSLVLSISKPTLCCAANGGSRITPDNPALAGEMIVIYATGLGLITPSDAKEALHTGFKYAGPQQNDPVEFVSALAGGKTANVISASALPGTVGLYKVVLELNSDLPTDPTTEMHIAQSIYVSNIATIAVVNPNPQ
jgi:uncharacterized protein (TIGR03437 family)